MTLQAKKTPFREQTAELKFLSRPCLVCRRSISSICSGNHTTPTYPSSKKANFESFTTLYGAALVPIASRLPWSTSSSPSRCSTAAHSCFGVLVPTVAIKMMLASQGGGTTEDVKPSSPQSWKAPRSQRCNVISSPSCTSAAHHSRTWRTQPWRPPCP